MKRIAAALLIAVITAFTACAENRQETYDIIIRNGDIVDGSGGPRTKGDVGITGGTIAAIGDLSKATAAAILDASGKIVAPGFIDIHTHTGDILTDPTAHNYIRQGVTTVLDGNCGGSELDIAAHLKNVAGLGIAINYGTLIGHNSIRSAVMGSADREPTAEELAKMKALVETGMKGGAVGLSSGLIYKPGFFSKTDEVIELAKVAAQYGGFYATHMRSEGNAVTQAVKEAIEIGEKAGIPVEISHLKILSVEHWGESAELLRLIEEARAKGIDVTADQYPYTASSTGLSVLLPAWALEGKGWKSRAAIPEERRKIKESIIATIVHERAGDDLNRIVIAGYPADSSIEGLGIAEILTKKGQAVTMDNAVELVLELLTAGDVSAIFHSVSEDDVKRMMNSPFVMHGSDGNITVMGKGVPHPRCYGTFPRVLACYVREKGIITLEEAIRKMTSLPATKIGLDDRGAIAVGKKADIVVFDPATIADMAEFGDPHRYPVGIDYVLVNGQVAVDHGELTGKRAGQVFYGPGMVQQ